VSKALPPVVLASASPRRRRLLAGLGVRFEVAAVDVPEAHDARDPVGTVLANAQRKYEACRALRPDACLLAADTLVHFGNRLIGKPGDLDEAARFLRAFSGRTLTVLTGLALALPGAAGPDLRVEASAVRFRVLDDGLIRDYLAMTRPFDRAGAFDIDEHGERLIESVRGSYTNVMGFPVETVRDWLLARGYPVRRGPVAWGKRLTAPLPTGRS
jgi:septum formation protein